MRRASRGLAALGARGRGCGGRARARGLCDPASPASAAAKLTRWNVGGPRADQVCFAAQPRPPAYRCWWARGAGAATAFRVPLTRSCDARRHWPRPTTGTSSTAIKRPGRAQRASMCVASHDAHGSAALAIERAAHACMRSLSGCSHACSGTCRGPCSPRSRTKSEHPKPPTRAHTQQARRTL